MSTFNAVRAVTDTLKTLLMARMPGINVEDTKAPASITTTTSQVGLYLYRVEQNPCGANLDWQTNTPSQLQAPPVALNLHYLLTPYGPDEREIQQTLGEVMRAFHEQPVIRTGDPVLSPDLLDMTEELRIVPRMLPLMEMLELWRAFEKVPFRLCATYEVSTVLIDSREQRNVERVQERVLDLETLR
jgi:hypothetical protein